MPDTTDLHIPDEAITALGSRFIWGFEASREAEDLIRKVAAPVVVAELRRLANLDDPVARVARVWLLARAAELDGGETPAEGEL